MSFQLYGFINASSKFPAFCIPVFRCADEDSLYAQEINSEGFISDFLPISEGDISSVIRSRLNVRHINLKLGLSGVYAFLLSKNEGFVGERSLVEEYVEDNMEIISTSAVANLMALRFVGCSYEKEVEAIDRISLLLKDVSIRRQFLRIEKAMLQFDEEVEIIDKLIHELSSSHSFARTHSIVSQIWSMRNKFRRSHYKIAMRACLKNAQVYSISGDEDVRRFVDFLIGSGNLQLTESAKSKLGRQ